MSTGDDIRKFSKSIEAAALAGGNYYIGKKAQGAPLAKARARNAPVRDHFHRSKQKRYKYEPLSEQYARQKAKEVGAEPVLVFSGRLRDTSGNADVTFDGKSIIIVWTKIPEYGAFHHTGGGNLPKRDPYTPDAVNLKEIAGHMQDFIDTRAKDENRTSRGSSARAKFRR